MRCVWPHVFVHGNNKSKPWTWCTALAFYSTDSLHAIITQKCSVFPWKMQLQVLKKLLSVANSVSAEVVCVTVFGIIWDTIKPKEFHLFCFCLFFYVCHTSSSNLSVDRKTVQIRDCFLFIFATYDKFKLIFCFVLENTVYTNWKGVISIYK